VNEDIAKVVEDLQNGEAQIPDFNLLVGGFPCQDYSVAKAKSQSHGIAGKKGVLWWEIFKLLDIKQPQYVLLENVDRLLTSPATRRGRDFAVMLESLVALGYEVEWKVVNSAEYGFPQRRKRIFIFAKKIGGFDNSAAFTYNQSVLGLALPSTPSGSERNLKLSGDIFTTSNDFNISNKAKPFETEGVCNANGTFMRASLPKPHPKTTLGDVVVPAMDVPEEYWISEEKIDDWAYLKGAKSIDRMSRTSGFVYQYKEGKMAFPDSLEMPSRTVVTGEGGSSPSRFKHVIRQDGRLRRLLPVELERLNGFPDNWTEFQSSDKRVSPSQRAFLMGNALVVGVIQKIAKEIKAIHPVL
jgi:DNA (cytosine-5)-methyltransferase 1